MVNPDERQGIYLKHTTSRSTKQVQSYDYHAKRDRQLYESKQVLLKYLGESESGAGQKKLSQGLTFMMRWVDRFDRTREASGIIDKFSMFTCTIQLSSSTARHLKVSPNQSINSALAVGGVLNYAYGYDGVAGSGSTVSEYRDCPHMIWVPPCNRRQTNDPETGLPVVDLTVNDRHFQLRVKKSGIPKSGHGVFLKYIPPGIPELDLDDSILKFGELIDVGE